MGRGGKRDGAGRKAAEAIGATKKKPFNRRIRPAAIEQIKAISDHYGISDAEALEAVIGEAYKNMRARVSKGEQA